MARLNTLSLAAVLSLSVAVIACRDNGGPTAPTEVTPIPTAIRIATGTITLQVPETTSLTATVYDQVGGVMSSSAPTWTSRDSTTARITPTGVVKAVETGDAWVVATVSGLTDSVQVRVRFPVGGGEARVRLSSSDSDRIRLMSTSGWSLDLVGTDTLDRAELQFSGPNASAVVVTEPPSPGETPIQTWSIGDLLAGATIFQVPAPGAFLVDHGQGSTVYVGRSGYLDLTDVEPATAGGEGRLRGHLHLSAIGYDLAGVDPENPTPPPGGDTLTCDFDFDVSVQQEEIGYALVHFDGGPVSTTQEFWDASVDWPNVNPPGTPLVELTVKGDATLTAALYDPRPGTLSIATQDPNGTFFAGHDVTSLRMTGSYPYFLASGQGGALTLTTVDWPQAPSSGELSGNIDASVLYWLQGDPQNAETGTAQVEFHALWPPRSDAQPAASAADAPSPWRPLFQLHGAR